MKNAKHTMAAFLAIVMISTVSANQIADIRQNKRYNALLTNNRETHTSIGYTTDEVAGLYQAVAYTNDKLTYINRIANNTTGYTKLHIGVLDVYNEPAETSEIIGSLGACEEVYIISTTDDWCKIRYGENKVGYVLKAYITTNYTEAIYAAMHYDNYKKAVVKTDGSMANVRSEASEDSPLICQLENQSELILVYDENGYTKVFYGDNYEPGFIISTSIELTNQWISKDEVLQRQLEISAVKEAAMELAAEKSAEAKRSAYTGLVPSKKGTAIVAEAKKYLGVPYVYGGTSPRGFDCSGFVQYVCRNVGISLSRTSSSQYGEGKPIKKSDLMPGDLVFFGSGRKINHVGIYVGDGKMIHSPQSGDVVSYCSINDGYRTKTYMGAKRLY